MPRCTVLLTVAALVLPGGALARSFAGFSIGAGASGHDLAVDARSSFSIPASASGSATGAGPMLDLGHTGSLSTNVRVTAGLRLYPVALETGVFPDDRVRIEDIGALYGRLGHVFEETDMIYAVLELGAADVTITGTSFTRVSDEIATAAFGLGYMRRLGAGTDVFVEILDRTYEDVRVSYPVDPFVDTRDYDITGGNLSVGIAARF